MKELLIISGKGGTGKTSITAAFAFLAKNKVLVDLDVDAPDMHLLLQPEVEKEEQFHSGNLAQVRPEDCTACGECAAACAYGAITQEGDAPAVVEEGACEGCSLCVEICPADAIDFPLRHCGAWYQSQTRLGPMIHAQLFPGQENSGRLVSLLRNEARTLAEERGAELILCDGTPGIGCPVISSLSGVHLACAVTEPTVSGVHDLMRVLELCAHFKVPSAVLVNKADLNPEQADRIEEVCAEQGVGFLGRLDFDATLVEAAVAGQVIGEFAPEGPSARRIAEVWSRLEELLAQD